MSDDKSLDIFGLKPVASAIDKTTDGAISGLSAVLSRICLPAAEELGLLFQDKIKSYRTKNASKIVEKADGVLNTENSGFNLQAHPYLVMSILDKGSWFEDPELHNVWGGLLASSCTEKEWDDSNLLFINLLSTLSSVQVKILNYVCANCKMHITVSGFLAINELIVLSVHSLKDLTSIDDINRLDRELDHLRSIELINPNGGGFNISDPNLLADITPTSLALNLYVRCQGSRLSPEEYFKLSEKQDAS